MRVVALIVVVCGCRVASAPGFDATTPRGDGLPEHVLTDVALWADVRTDVPRDSPTADRASDTALSDGSGSGADGPDGGGCSLLVASCPTKEACFPFPFEGVPGGGTRCFMPGSGGEQVPCQSQLDCDSTTLCSAPGQQPDSFCLLRCDLQSPACPRGETCSPYAGYLGVGVCQ